MRAPRYLMVAFALAAATGCATSSAPTGGVETRSSSLPAKLGAVHRVSLLEPMRVRSGDTEVETQTAITVQLLARDVSWMFGGRAAHDPIPYLGEFEAKVVSASNQEVTFIGSDPGSGQGTHFWMISPAVHLGGDPGSLTRARAVELYTEVRNGRIPALEIDPIIEVLPESFGSIGELERWFGENPSAPIDETGDRVAVPPETDEPDAAPPRERKPVF